jgi:hypothetical protein
VIFLGKQQIFFKDVFFISCYLRNNDNNNDDDADDADADDDDDDDTVTVIIIQVCGPVF